MRNNTIGKLRGDLDVLLDRQAKLEAKLNIAIGAVIFCIAGVLYLALAT